MKSVKLLLSALLFCIIFPVCSNADPLADAVTAISNKDFTKAIELLAPLVEQNNLSAKNLLGLLYFKGEGVAQDVKKGLAMIMDAANQGHENAQANAVALTGELAKLGEPVALYNAGYMCIKGWGGKQDPNGCVKIIEKAAEAGHVKAAKVLSGIYSKGSYGVTPDKDKASFYENLAKNQPAAVALP